MFLGRIFSFELEIFVCLKRMPLLSGLWELFLEEGFTVFRKDLGFKGIMFDKFNLTSFSVSINIFEE
jgi:hypothetical protein